MSVTIDDIIKYIKDDLKISISKNKEKQLKDYYYKDTKDRVYWSIDIDERSMKFFFEGIITEEEYKLIQTLDKKTTITFGEISKHCLADCTLDEIVFSRDLEDISRFKTGNNASEFDLMCFFYESDKLK